MKLRAVVLGLCALTFAGVGLAFLLAPTTMAAFVDLSLGSSTADNDLRAVYGGMNLGVGLFLVAATRRPAWQQPALVLVTITLGCMAGSRALSWLMVGWPSRLGFLLHAAEIVGCLAAALTLRYLRGERR